MDVGRLEERVAARTIRAEARARRRELQQAEKRRKARARLQADAREVTTGEDDDGRWLAVLADTDPSGMRFFLCVLGLLLGALTALPLFVWWSLKSVPVWLLLTVVASLGGGWRYGMEREARLVVTPRGYWAFLDRGRVRASGRVEELRITLGGYRPGSAPHGMLWMALHGPDGKLCESEQLVAGGATRVQRFADETGVRVARLR